MKFLIISLLISLVPLFLTCGTKEQSHRDVQTGIKKGPYELFNYYQEATVLAETFYHLKTVPDIKTFDSILNNRATLLKNISSKPDQTNPAYIDSMIDLVYHTWRITFNPDDHDIKTILPHCVYNRKNGSCLGVSLLFLLLAERTGLPLYGVYVPGHFFVRYDNGSYLRNIEPNKSGTQHSDAYYRKRYLPDDTIVYAMRNLLKKETVAVLFYTIGSLCLTDNKFPEALSCFRRACSLMPEFVEAWGNKAIAFANLKLMDSAHAAFQKAYLLYPKLPKLMENIGSFELSRKNVPGALAAYREGLGYFPGNKNLLYDIAYTFHGNGVYDSAFFYIQKISRNDTDSTAVLLTRKIIGKLRQ